MGLSSWIGGLLVQTMLVIAVVALLAGLPALVAWRRAQRGADARRGPRPDINPDGSGRFHAISIRARPDACDAARALHGQRFLSATAPTLPLPGCDAHTCHCRFARHRDRRSGEDRRSPFQGGYGGSSTRREQDRRESPDRRRGGDREPDPTQ